MKANLLKTFAAAVCLIVFASMIHAQEKPRALKFDEFTVDAENNLYSRNAEPDVKARIERFGKQIEKERDVRIFIICYRARITKITQKEFARPFVNLMYETVFKDKTKVREFYVFDGGYRQQATVEFWIVPNDAEPPVPTPTIDKTDAAFCPSAYVWGESVFDEDNTLSFTSGINETDEYLNYPMKWKISGGKIVGDSNLKKIKVKLNEGRKSATAYAEYENFPYPCPKVFSASAAVNGKLYLIDDFGRTANGETRARLDGFISKVFENPKAKAYIIIYGNRATGRRDIVRLETLIKSHYTFRGVDMNILTFIDGGYREDVATELWLSFDDNQKPIPTPTVDAKFVGIPAAKKAMRRKSK